MTLSEWIALAASSGDYGLQWLVLGITIVVCALVMLGILMTRQHQQRINVDVDRDYIANDEMSWTELQSTMERHGVKRISPLGEKFDYNFHQAMFEMPHADHPPGTVVEVVQHGYVLHDRLLRPAMVGVSKAAEESPQTDLDPE